jgi:hypothetical protein
MKVCVKCDRTYSDDQSFCTVCGEKLSDHTSKIELPKSKRIQYIIISMAVFAVAVVAIFIIIEAQRFDNSAEKEEYARSQKLIDNYISSPTISDLRIEDWKWKLDGDYIYIDGSVKNIGDIKIGYYEVTAKFYDSTGNVIDTDWSNGLDVDPGNSSKFSMMYKNDNRIDKIHLEISQVS